MDGFDQDLTTDRITNRITEKITIKGSGKIQNFAEQKTFFKLSATIISNINCHKRSPHGIYRRNVWMETQKTKNTVNKDRKWWTYRNRASFSFFVFQDAPWRGSVKQVTALAFRDVSSLINCNAKCNNSCMKSRIESLIGRRRSDRRSDHGLDHGFDHWSYHGLDYGLDHGLDHGSYHGSDHGSNDGSDHRSDHGFACSRLSVRTIEKRVGDNRDQLRAGPRSEKERAPPLSLPDPARPAPARFFNRPHWQRAWNKLITDWITDLTKDRIK